MHRSEIIRTFHAANLELAILATVNLSVCTDDHAGDILCALDVRNVERFDSSRKTRQLQSLLHLFQHPLHIRLEHPKTLFESQLSILLNQIDHVALFAALRSQDMHAPAAAFAKCFL